MRARSDAEEAFSIFAEHLWKGLSKFEFRCSLRGWLYTLARNAANRYVSAPHHRRERHHTSPGDASVSAVIEQARSATEIHRRTSVKEKIRALRERLPLEDQTLLILHVDRGLPWRELAMIMHEDGESLDEAALTRESARLRKRFERVRDALREFAIEEGLLKP
jgi:RNA polymerase sigma-70 factor (ECF subfamily)